MRLFFNKFYYICISEFINKYKFTVWKIRV